MEGESSREPLLGEEEEEAQKKARLLLSPNRVESGPSSSADEADDLGQGVWRVARTPSSDIAAASPHGERTRRQTVLFSKFPSFFLIQ